MAGALGTIHHEQPARDKSAARQQAFNALFKRNIRERQKLVEQRRDVGRVDHDHREAEHQPHQPHVQPPQAAHFFHQPEGDKQQRNADSGSQCQAFDGVDEVELPGGFVKTELLLDHKSAVQIEWRGNERGDNHQPGENGKTQRVRAAEPGRRNAMQQPHAATQGDRQQK